MRKYRMRIDPVVEAQRFDDPTKRPKNVVQRQDGEFAVQLQNQNFAPIELGDWVVVHRNGFLRPLNHETFMKMYERVKDIDIDDVTEQYRSTDDEVQ